MTAIRTLGSSPGSLIEQTYSAQSPAERWGQAKRRRYGLRPVSRAGRRAERRDANFRPDDRVADRGGGGDRLVRAAAGARARPAGEGDHGQRSRRGVQALRHGSRVPASANAELADRAAEDSLHGGRHRRGRGRGRGGGGPLTPGSSA